MEFQTLHPQGLVCGMSAGRKQNADTLTCGSCVYPSSERRRETSRENITYLAQIFISQMKTFKYIFPYIKFC